MGIFRFKELFLIPCFLFLAFSGIGQSPVIDSLLQVAGSGPDTSKVKAYRHLCEHLYGRYPTKAEKMAKKALDLAEKVDLDQEVAKCMTCYAIATELQGKYEEAIQKYHKALVFAKRIDLPFEIARGYQNLGIVHNQTGELQKAISYTDSAATLFSKLGKDQEAAGCWSNLGNIYRRTGELDKSLEVIIKALQVYEENPEGYQPLANTLHNRALTYEKMGEMQKALENYRKAREMFRNGKNDRGVALIDMNMARIHNNDSNYSKAIELNKKALHVLKELKDHRTVSMIHNNLAGCYEETGNHRSALEHHKKALDLKKKIGDLEGIAVSLINIGGNQIEHGQTRTGIEKLNKGIHLADSLHSLETLKLAYQKAFEGFEETGDHEKAFHYHKKYKAISDTILNEKKLEKISKYRTRYETEQKEKQVAHLEKETAEKKLRIQKQKAENEEQRVLLLGLTLVLVILAAGGGLVFYRNKQRQKTELAQKEVEMREEMLDATVQAQEEERKRIAKDLHDGVAQQLSGLKLAWQKLTGELTSKAPDEKERLDELTKVLDEAGSDVRNISHQMMPRVLSEAGLIPAISDMLEKTLSLSDLSYQFEHFNLEGERFPEKVETSIFRIAQELINNVIKHSNADQVNVQLLKNKEALILIVEDNGTGFGEKGPEREGIGLMNINSRVNTLKGTVNFEPSPDSGTLATVRIPLEQ